MFKLGWQVLRARRYDALDPARLRRAAWVAAGSAAVVLVALVVLQLAVRWAGDGAVLPIAVVVLCGAAAGLLVFACFPTASTPEPAATINGRQVRPGEQRAARPSVQKYLPWRERPVTSVDRAAVLADVPLVQRALIRRVARLGPLTVGAALLVLAGAVAGAPVLSFAWMVVYVFVPPSMVSTIGRAERARVAAVAVPPLPADTTTKTSGAQGGPRGSKIRLPGD